MTYRRHPNLIARPATGDVWDTISGAGKGILNVFTTGEQAKGAAAVLTAQQQAMLQQQQGFGGGIGMGTILLLAGAGIGIYLLVRKKKPA